jgi:hypothetical protein
MQYSTYANDPMAFNQWWHSSSNTSSVHVLDPNPIFGLRASYAFIKAKKRKYLMAHLLEKMAYIGEVPWRGLGSKLSANQPIEG